MSSIKGMNQFIVTVDGSRLRASFEQYRKNLRRARATGTEMAFSGVLRDDRANAIWVCTHDGHSRQGAKFCALHELRSRIREGTQIRLPTARSDERGPAVPNAP